MQKNLKKILTIIIVFFPLLHSYGFRGLDFGMILFTIIGILLICTAGIIKLKKNFTFPKYYLYFFFYILTIPLLLSIIQNSFNVEGVVRGILGTVGYTITLGIACTYFDANYGFSLYKKVVVISCIFFIFQEITFNFLNYRISGLLPFFPVIYSGVETMALIELHSNALRSSSFFLEPAHFAQYLLPYLALELFRKNNKYFLSIGAVFITIVIILLSSGNGLIICVMLWICWLFFENKNIIKKYIFVALCIPIVLFASSLYLNSDNGKIVAQRSELLIETANSDYIAGEMSGYVRIFRGYNVFNAMPTINQFLGIGHGNHRTMIEADKKLRYLFGREEVYMNCVQCVLVYGGIIGLSLFLLYWLTLFKGNNLKGKMIVLSFLVMALMASTYNSPIMLIYIIFAFFLKSNNSFKGVETENPITRKIRDDNKVF